MKLLKSFALIGVAALALVSCKEKYDAYTPGEPENTNVHNVCFKTPSTTTFQLDPADPTEVTFTLLRDSILVGGKLTMDELTVPVELTADNAASEGIFKLATVTFPKDSVWTDFKVSFPDAVAGTVYAATLEVTDPAYIHTYSNVAKSLSFSVQRVKWNNIGKGLYYDDLIAYWSKVDYDPVEVEFLQSDSDPNSFRILDPYTKILAAVGATAAETPSEYISLRVINKGDKVGSTTVTIDDGLYFEEVATGYEHPSYALPIVLLHPINFSSTADPSNWTHSAVKNYQEDGTPGDATLAPFYYMYGLGGFNYSQYDDDIYIIFPGFTPTDYTISLKADYPVDGATPIDVEVGTDIATIKYAFYEGKLAKSFVEEKSAAIAEGTEPCETLAEFEEDEATGARYSTLQVKPAVSGEYTLLVVGLDADDETQTVETLVFNAITAEDAKELAVNINVFAEPTPSRYIELDEYTSFAFGFYGSDITELHYTVLPTSKVDDAALQEIKADEEGYYALDEEGLKLVNAAGGYYDVVSELTAGVSYTVVVWATNGSLDTFATAEFTTTPSPEVWKSLGTGSWTDDFFTTFWNVDNLTWDVEVEQSEDDPSRYRVIYPYDGKYGYNEEGDWDASRDYNIVITVADEDHVYITPQEIGVNWGYGMISIASAAGRFVGSYSFEVIEANDIPFGTLKDNVITFPKNALGISLASYNNGGWYNANTNEAFKLVLPGSDTAVPSETPAKKANKASVNKAEKAVKVNGAKNTYTREGNLRRDDVKVTVSYNRVATNYRSLVELTK